MAYIIKRKYILKQVDLAVVYADVLNVLGDVHMEDLLYRYYIISLGLGQGSPCDFAVGGQGNDLAGNGLSACTDGLSDGGFHAVAAGHLHADQRHVLHVVLG